MCGPRGDGRGVLLPQSGFLRSQQVYVLRSGTSTANPNGRAGEPARSYTAIVRFKETRLPGAYVIELDAHRDERGAFARTYCEREFAAHGLHTRYPQCNLSRNRRAGTLRGMHYQAAPHREVKLVRCVSGAIYDVIVDMRPSSPTRMQWAGVTLTAGHMNALYVPEGFAHGFLTLQDDTEVYYHMGELYIAEAARGFRWNDPLFGIEWPTVPSMMSDRDASYPDFDPGAFDG
jgi:dTDP-4-dehydrorhamnose 3,5-epimerase